MGDMEYNWVMVGVEIHVCVCGGDEFAVVW